LEKKLVKIWSEILAREENHISIDDNFFQLGGHSLKATTLVSRIKKDFNIDVPMTELFKKTSIRLLGEYIDTARGEPISRQEDSLLLLRKEPENNNHMFLIHDGTGEVESYASFCNRLDMGFNYWGIRADRLENHKPLKQTVKGIAQKYVQKMQTVQPLGSGPYYIAGWSVGGVIAFEMARQLEKQHQDIAFLGLVDAPAPSRWLWWGTKSRMKLGKFNLTSEMNLVRRLVMEDEKINKKLKEIKNIDGFWPTITDYLENSGFDKKAIQRRMMRYGMQALPHFQRLNLRDSIYFFNMSRTLINAVRKYRPTGKINAPIHYFKARQTVEIKEKKWQKYTTAPVNLYEIHGDHFSIFNKNLDDFVKVFGKILKQGTHNHVFHKNSTNNRK
jgi:thioesterase domain-containing protein/acyl carrier protein